MTGTRWSVYRCAPRVAMWGRKDLVAVCDDYDSAVEWVMKHADDLRMYELREVPWFG